MDRSAYPNHTPNEEPDPRFRLDHTQLPRTLELAISEELLAQLNEQAHSQGREVDEIILDALSRLLSER